MARRPVQSPSAAAIERLGKLSSMGTSPGRMERAVSATVAGWRSTEDTDRARRFTEELRADVLAGLAAAKEQVENIDESEAGAGKHAGAVVAALRALADRLTVELRTM